MLITNNDGAPVGETGCPDPRPAWCPTGNVTWLEQHNASLAAFLLAANTEAYFGSGKNWADAGWDYNWPDLAPSRQLGRPLGSVAQWTQPRACSMHATLRATAMQSCSGRLFLSAQPLA